MADMDLMYMFFLLYLIFNFISITNNVLKGFYLYLMLFFLTLLLVWIQMYPYVGFLLILEITTVLFLITLVYYFESSLTILKISKFQVFLGYVVISLCLTVSILLKSSIKHMYLNFFQMYTSLLWNDFLTLYTSLIYGNSMYLMTMFFFFLLITFLLLFFFYFMFSDMIGAMNNIPNKYFSNYVSKKLLFLNIFFNPEALISKSFAKKFF